MPAPSDLIKLSRILREKMSTDNSTKSLDIVKDIVEELTEILGKKGFLIGPGLG